MKKTIILLLIFQTLLFSTQTIRFSPLPMENASKTLEIFTPLIDYLEKKSGKKVELVYRTKNEDIISGLINGEIDIAHFGPLPYAKITKKYSKIQPIVQFLESDGSNKYTCTLFKRKGTSIDLKTIRNKQFALTHKYSTCGFAFAQEILKPLGNSLENNNFKYLGSHYNTITDVALGEYDLGTAKTSIFKKLNYLDVQAIATSSSYPALMLIANTGTLSKDTILKIKNIFLNISKNDTKNWDSKIKKIAVSPDIEHLEQYKQNNKDIELKDE